MSSPRILHLRGTLRQIGHAHGEACRDEIAALADERLRLVLAEAEACRRPATAADVLAFAGGCVDVQAKALPRVHEEFAAIAEAARIEPARLMIANGFTDIVDVFARSTAAGTVRARGGRPSSTPGGRASGGCTSCVISADATDDGHALLAQNWDMHASAQRHVVVIERRPTDGPASLTLTTTGCLSLAGINAAGLAIGNNNFRTTDARVGVMYLALIHHALGCTSLAAAVNGIIQTPRLSGHNYLLIGPDGEPADVETTATTCEVLDPAGGFFVHTNHCLAERLRPFESDDAVDESTFARWNRMTRLLHEQAGAITPAVLMELLTDETGDGDRRVCRRDPNDTLRTCAAIVASPATRTLWVAPGPPAEATFVEMTL